MSKQVFVLAALAALAFTSVATAEPHRGFDPRETAGVWSTVLTGTFGGQPYYDSAVVTISADGRSAIARDDTTIGPATSTCTLSAFTTDGVGTVACTFTSGPATGASYSVHYVYTDYGQHLVMWAALPDAGFYASGSLTRP